MKRFDGRTADQFRKVKITKNYLEHPTASVLMEIGKTKVICSASIEKGVPGWMRAQRVAGGWLTAEYGMLPSSTHSRMRRESTSGKQGGRTVEIQRLIGRSLRSVVDLKALGQNTIYLDCDVIDADGGTRCASITGASVALQMALKKLFPRQDPKKPIMREGISAISVGIVAGKPVLDLCYEEDSKADVDMNVIMTDSGKFVEIQGTAEEQPFSYEEMEQMFGLARNGLKKICEIQKEAVSGKKKHKGEKHPSKNLGSLGDVLGDVEL